MHDLAALAMVKGERCLLPLERDMPPLEISDFVQASARLQENREQGIIALAEGGTSVNRFEASGHIFSIKRLRARILLNLLTFDKSDRIDFNAQELARQGVLIER